MMLFSFHFEDASAALQAGGETLVLYDAASQAIPIAPLMSFADFPPGAAQSFFSNDGTILDTTASGRDTYAGWIASQAATPGFPDLDRAAGFQVDFSLQVESESHRNNNRSGSSIILLGEDAKGIELAFWENEIWAQSDSSTGGLFQHGEGIIFPTTTSLVDYQLTVNGDTYTLTANSQAILTGPVRDYSDFDGFPNPYQTQNFLFLGDNTTSAQARVRLGHISIIGTNPVMPTGTSAFPSTSTSLPLLTVSPGPLPSITPVPTPAPTGKVPSLCPSAGFFVAVMIPTVMLQKYLQAKSRAIKNRLL